MVPLPLSDNNIWLSNYPIDYILNIYHKNITNIDYIYFIFYLNNKADNIIITKPIIGHFSVLNNDKNFLDNPIILKLLNYFISLN
jgi:hypothetical protein